MTGTSRLFTEGTKAGNTLIYDALGTFYLYLSGPLLTPNKLKAGFNFNGRPVVFDDLISCRTTPDSDNSSPLDNL